MAHWKAAGIASIIAPLIVSGCDGQIRGLKPVFGTSDWNELDVVDEPYKQGKQHLAARQYGLAVKFFQSAVTRDPNSIQALNGLAAAYDNLGRGELAEKYYRRALVKDPVSAQTLNNLGYSYLLRGKYEQAASYLSDANIAAPKSQMITTNQKMADASLSAASKAVTKTAAAEDKRDTPTVANTWIQRTSKVVQNLITRPTEELAKAVKDAKIEPRLASYSVVESKAAGSIPGPGFAPRPATWSLNTTQRSIPETKISIAPQSVAPEPLVTSSLELSKVEALSKIPPIPEPPAGPAQIVASTLLQIPEDIELPTPDVRVSIADEEQFAVTVAEFPSAIIPKTITPENTTVVADQPIGPTASQEPNSGEIRPNTADDVKVSEATSRQLPDSDPLIYAGGNNNSNIPDSVTTAGFAPEVTADTITRQITQSVSVLSGSPSIPSTPEEINAKPSLSYQKFLELVSIRKTETESTHGASSAPLIPETSERTSINSIDERVSAITVPGRDNKIGDIALNKTPAIIHLVTSESPENAELGDKSFYIETNSSEIAPIQMVPAFVRTASYRIITTDAGSTFMGPNSTEMDDHGMPATPQPVRWTMAFIPGLDDITPASAKIEDQPRVHQAVLRGEADSFSGAGNFKTIGKDLHSVQVAFDPAGNTETPSVEVSNGAGRRHMASRMRGYLAGKGFDVKWLTNADHFSHRKTIIFYRPGFRSQALVLAGLLPAKVTLELNDPQRADVRIELGGDLLKFDKRALYRREKKVNDIST